MNERKTWQRWVVYVLGMVVVVAALGGLALQTTWGQVLAAKAGKYTRVLAAYVPIGDGEVRFIRQLITADSSTSRTIMWESVKPEASPVVEYRLKDGAAAKQTATKQTAERQTAAKQTEAATKPQESDSGVKRVAATESVLTDDDVTRYLYTATLTGLTPRTTYEYRVGYENKRGDWHPLTTAGSGANKVATTDDAANTSATTGDAKAAKSEDFTALIFPDSQSADYRGWDALAKEAYKRNPTAAFFINMGDLVDNGEDASQWDAWFTAVEPMIEDIPFVGVMGNHETYNLQWQVREPKVYLSLFDFPAVPQREDNNRYYSFDYNDVHFVVLDTQLAERPEAERAQALAREEAWLRQDLATTKARWKVVLMHKDTLRYPNTKRLDTVPGITDTGYAFMPIFDAYHVDAVVSAHYHMYRRRGHIKDFKRDESGPLYIISGVAGDVRYATLWKSHPLDTFVSPYPAEANYIMLTKTDDRLTFEAYLPNGTKFDEVQVNKQ
ncbi:purple acid phosphatase family protein [Veillonella magna]|uniref:purple acid phosphatase family protein n=1 Tax=Veillonella magna TaxID=464322 RepID=UPI0023F0A39E|nr:metallophosphoesterase family protein [Veillonella magna]MBD8976202.1 metallophosphoesterase family protein [Veillonella magna]